MTPEERAARVLARIKELDDPERPTPYALHAMITREVEEAIAETREACAKICDDLPMDLLQENDGVAARDAAAAAIRGRT